MARPTKANPTGAQKKPKFTPETIQKLEQAFAMDCSIPEACLYADIAISTYYLWKESNPKLMERFQALRNKPVLKARKRVLVGIDESYQNAMDYLKRKRKDEFSEKQITEHAGGFNIATADLEKTIRERLKKKKK